MTVGEQTMPLVEEVPRCSLRMPVARGKLASDTRFPEKVETA